MNDLRFGKAATSEFVHKRRAAKPEEVPVVPMLPAAVESLGCEGDDFGQVAIDARPEFDFGPEAKPTPAGPWKEAPAPDPSPRFGIWSDGTLALRVKAGFVELESAEFAALLEFVDRVRKGRVL